MRRKQLRGERGVTMVELVIALAVLGFLIGGATIGYAGYVERSTRTALLSDLDRAVELQQELRMREAGAFVSIDELKTLGWEPSDDVIVEESSVTPERVYVRLKHARSERRCSVDYSPVSRNARNRKVCFEGLDDPNAEPVRVADAPDAAPPPTVDVTPPPPTVVPLSHLVSPAVGDLADQVLAPSAAGSATFTVTNRSREPRRYRFEVASSNPTVVSSVATPGPITLGGGSSAPATVSFAMTGGAVADDQSLIELRALDEADPAYSGDGTVRVRTALVLMAPAVVAPAAETRDAGETFGVVYQVTNRTNASRELDFASVVTGPDMVLAGSAPAVQRFAPGETRAIAVTYRLDPASDGGTVSRAALVARDQAAPSYQTTSGDFAVTTRLVLAAPTVTAPADRALSPGSPLNVAFAVTNNSNAARSFSIVPSAGGNLTIVSSTNTGTQTIPRGATITVRVRYRLSDPSVGATVSDASLVATDLGAPAYATAQTFRVTTNTILLAPAMTAPAARTASPSEVFDASWTVTNRSNVARTIAISAAAGGDVVAVAATPAGGVLFAPYETRTISTRNTTSATATAGTVSRPELYATDAGVGGTMQSFPVTTNTVLAAPTVSNLGPATGDPGTSLTRIFRITNNSNTSRTFRLAGTSTNTGAALDPGDPANITIPAYDFREVSLPVSVYNRALGGSTSSVQLQATDTGSGALVGTGSFGFTTNTVLLAPALTNPANAAGNPGQTLTAGYTLTNRSNVARTFSLLASSSSARTVYDPADPATITVPAYESRAIGHDYRFHVQAIGTTQSTVGVRATDTGATALNGTGSFTATTNTVLLPPATTAPAARNENPNASFRVTTWTVTNRSNVARTITLSAGGGTDVTLVGASPIGGVAFAPYETRTITADYRMAVQSVAGTVSSPELYATDPGVGGTMGALRVTTNTVLVRPTVSSPLSRSANPGATYSRSFTVTNQSNTVRTLNVVAPVAGDHTITSSSPALGSQSFAAYESRTFTVSYQLGTTSVAGTASTGTVNATDATTGTGSGVFTVTTNLVLQNPAQVAPANHSAVIGSTFSRSWTVRNETNATRTLNISAAVPGSSALTVTSASGTGSVSYAPFESRTVTVYYGVETGSTPTSTHVTNLTVTDALATSYTSTTGFTFTVLNRNPVAGFTWTPIVQAGQAWTFTSTSTDPDAPADGIASVSWNWGDMSADVAGAGVSKTFTRGGTYTVRVTATDNYGGSHSVARSVFVNTAPVACINPLPSSVAPGEWFDVSSCSSDADAGQTLSHAWSFSDGAGSPGNVTSFSRAFYSPGTYWIDLQVSDGNGGTAWTSVSITVSEPNQPPTACFRWNPNVPRPNQQVDFDGSCSSDDGLPNPPASLTYSWTFYHHDGTTVLGTSSGITPTFSYPEDGDFPVCLDVFDGEYGDRACAPVPVRTYAPPEVTATGNDVYRGDVMQWSGTARDLDNYTGTAVTVGDGIVRKWWDTGETTDVVSRTAAWNETLGAHNNCFNAEDDEGEFGQACTLTTVIVRNHPPMPSVSWTGGCRETSSGSGRYDCSWNVDDTSTDVENTNMPSVMPLNRTWTVGAWTSTAAGITVNTYSCRLTECGVSVSLTSQDDAEGVNATVWVSGTSGSGGLGGVI